jgi:hypothetical protein
MTNISGMWLGTYWQIGIPTRFEMSIIQGNNILSGNILDQSHLGEASLIGEIIGKTIRFRKSYLTGSRHSIDYLGTLSDDLNLIQGIWQEDSFNKGNWEASRQEDNLTLNIGRSTAKLVGSGIKFSVAI